MTPASMSTGVSRTEASCAPPAISEKRPEREGESVTSFSRSTKKERVSRASAFFSLLSQTTSLLFTIHSESKKKRRVAFSHTPTFKLAAFFVDNNALRSPGPRALRGGPRIDGTREQNELKANLIALLRGQPKCLCRARPHPSPLGELSLLVFRRDVGQSSRLRVPLWKGKA